MHLGRFHRVIDILDKEITSSGIVTLFTNLIANLAGSISSPSQATSTLFQQSLKDMLDVLSKAESNSLTPSQKEFFSQIGGYEYCGNGLSEKVVEVISENNITPSAALAELQGIQTEFNEFVTSVSQVNQSFTKLNVEYESLEEEEGEFGISLPKVAVGESAINLVDELKWINNLFSAFSELVGESIKSPKVRTISSTDWQFFLDQSPIVIPAIIFSIERIVALIKSNLEIKVLKNQLENNLLPKDITSLIEKHIDTAMKSGIRDITEVVVGEFGKDVEEGRKNELKNQINFGLLKLAMRINEGADVEVSMGLPEKPKLDEAASEKEKGEQAQRLKEYSKKEEFAISINSRGLSVSNQIIEKFKDQPLLTDYEKKDEKK